MIEIYTKDNCTSCEGTKQLLTSNHQNFVEKKIGVDISVEDLLSLFPDVRVAPVVVIDGRMIETSELKGRLQLLNE
jgi:arsenate reductase-like glutaredoxin family protein